MTSTVTTFFFPYNTCIKQINSMLLWLCTVIEHSRCQDVVRTFVTLSAAPCVQQFCFYYILMSSVIFYETDAAQWHVIYLLICQLWWWLEVVKTSVFLKITLTCMIRIHKYNISFINTSLCLEEGLIIVSNLQLISLSF